MEKAKVYTANSCMQCTMTKKTMDKYSVPYDTFNIDEDEAAMDYVLAVAEETGDRTLPLVEYEDEAWNGFRLENIKRLGAIALAEKEYPNGL